MVYHTFYHGVLWQIEPVKLWFTIVYHGTVLLYTTVPYQGKLWCRTIVNYGTILWIIFHILVHLC